MTIKITTLAENPGADIYYSTSFRNMIESYLQTLIKSNNTSLLAIDPQAANKYVFDFYGLLKSYGIPPQYRWIALRMNGLRSSSEYRGEVFTVLIPDSSEIEKLRSLLQSS